MDLLGRFSAKLTPDPYNPGYPRGPRSIIFLSGQRNSDSSTNLVYHYGFEAKLTNKSKNHLIKNWFIHIGHKFRLLIDAINKMIKTLKICRNKFKSVLKFKRKFRLLKNLLPILSNIWFVYE